MDTRVGQRPTKSRGFSPVGNADRVGPMRVNEFLFLFFQLSKLKEEMKEGKYSAKLSSDTYLVTKT